MQSTQAIATPLSADARKRAQAVVLRRLEELRSLEKERNSILTALQNTLSQQRAMYERKVIAQIPYNPLQYE